MNVHFYRMKCLDVDESCERCERMANNFTELLRPHDFIPKLNVDSKLSKTQKKNIRFWEYNEELSSTHHAQSIVITLG